MIGRPARGRRHTGDPGAREQTQRGDGQSSWHGLSFLQSAQNPGASLLAAGSLPSGGIAYRVVAARPQDDVHRHHQEADRRSNRKGRSPAVKQSRNPPRPISVSLLWSTLP